MREADLPSPGVGNKMMQMRRLAANYLSALEISGNKSPNNIPADAPKVKAFFDACSAAANELTKIMPKISIVTAGGAKTFSVGSILATTVNKGGSAGAVTYVSSDPAVATVNSSGIITGVSAGDILVTARMAGTATYRGSNATVGVSVAAV